jgi:hypothetical protein
VRHLVGLEAAPGDDPDVRAGRLRVGDHELQRNLYPEPSPARASRPAPEPTPPQQRRARVEAEADTITPDRTAWSIAGRAYDSATTLYVLPDGSRVRGDAMRRWDEIPLGTRVLLGESASATTADAADAADADDVYVDGLLLVSQPAAAADLLGSAERAATTTYLFPSGSVRTGAELSGDAEGRGLLQRLPPGTRILVGYVNAGSVTRSRSLTRVAGDRWNYPSTYYRVPGGSVRSGAEIRNQRVPHGTLVFFRR